MITIADKYPLAGPAIKKVSYMTGVYVKKSIYHKYILVAFDLLGVVTSASTVKRAKIIIASKKGNVPVNIPMKKAPQKIPMIMSRPLVV